jgi:hypothetical protein
MTLEILPTSPHDFNFVIGDWRVRHRRLKERLVGSNEWVEFSGEMSTRKILGGFGNIEDNLLRFPQGEFRAIALRSYDAARQVWSIWWLDGRFPDRIDVPVVGAFKDGVGTFFAKDMVAGVPVAIRFIWSRVDARQLRWEQAFSTDDGSTWETNWIMDFQPREQG